MTAGVTDSTDRREDGGGAVPQDEGAVLSTVENGEAVAIPNPAFYDRERRRQST